MKILHVSYSDLKGGAAIASNRLHNGFLKKKDNLWKDFNRFAHKTLSTLF